MTISKIGRNATDTSISDSGDATAITIDSSEKVGIGTTTPSQLLNLQASTNPVIQISTLSDSNPTDAGALDIVEKQSSATSTATFGQNGVYGFRTILNGSDNTLRIKSGSQTTVTDRVTLARDTGNLTLSTGNLVIGTSGKGIDFSATSQAGGVGSELFDDYEEGTFSVSATIASGSLAISGSFNLLSYTKIGHRVFISGGIRLADASAGGSPSGAVHLDDLPFTPASQTEDENLLAFFVAHQSMTGMSSGGQPMIGQISGGNTNIFLFTQDQNNYADVGNHFTDNSILRFNFSYIAA